MITENSINDLEHESYLRLERVGWIVERVAYVLLVGIVVSGVVGAFGSGPLSRKTMSMDSPPLTVTFPRLHLRQRPAVIEVEWQEGAQPPMQLWVDQHMTEHLNVENVFPE